MPLVKSKLSFYPSFEQMEADLNDMIASRTARPTKQVRNNPCADCAVIHGLYTEIAEDVAKHPDKNFRQRSADHWDCHHGGRCEGAANVICGGGLLES